MSCTARCGIATKERTCKMLLVLQFLVLLAVGSTVEALTCKCDDCANSDTCDPGKGGRCYIQTLNFPGLAKSIRRRCFEAQSVDLCGTSNNRLVIQCCDTDLCNDVVDPPPEDPVTTTLSPSQTSIAVLSSTAVATAVPVPTPDHTITSTPSPSQAVFTTTTSVLTPMPTVRNEVTSQQAEYQCVHHHSSWPQVKTFCRTNTSCFWRIRRKTDGEVIFQQGCSTKPCEQSIRNREAIFCCTGNLCNDVAPPVAPTKPAPMCTTPSPSIKQTVTEPEPSIVSNALKSTVTNTDPVEPSCAPILEPILITVTMTVTTTTTAESLQTQNPVIAIPTDTVPQSKVEEELCLAVTGLGVGFLFTSVISSLIACVCMKLFLHKCQKHHHYNKPAVKI